MRATGRWIGRNTSLPASICLTTTGFHCDAAPPTWFRQLAALRLDHRDTLPAPASRRAVRAAAALSTTIDKERQMGIEDPDRDVAEQRIPLVDLDEDGEALPGSAPLEADPADFADQNRTVSLVEEED
jgi:hypothetical protein